MGLSTWQLILLVLVVAPFLHIIFSSRSKGGATFGWLLIAMLFSLLGYAVFLIATQPDQSHKTPS